MITQIFSHSGDSDGLVGGWLASKMTGLPCTFLAYNELDKVEDGSIIVDLNFPQDHKVWGFKECHIYDHHKVDFPYDESRHIINPAMCGAFVVHDALIKGTHGIELVDRNLDGINVNDMLILTDIADRFLKQDERFDIARAWAEFCIDIRPMFEAGVYHSFFSIDKRELLHYYLETRVYINSVKHLKAVEQIKKSGKHITVAGYEVIRVMYNGLYDLSTVGEHIARDTGKTVQFVIGSSVNFDDRTVVISCRGPHARDIAVANGGGGHQLAAGYRESF